MCAIVQTALLIVAPLFLSLPHPHIDYIKIKQNQCLSLLLAFIIREDGKEENKGGGRLELAYERGSEFHC